jgi:hypothetical protein
MQLVFPGGQRPVYIYVEVWRICRKPLIQTGKYTIHNIALTRTIIFISSKCLKVFDTLVFLETKVFFQYFKIL